MKEGRKGECMWEFMGKEGRNEACMWCEEKEGRKGAGSRERREGGSQYVTV